MAETQVHNRRLIIVVNRQLNFVLFSKQGDIHCYSKVLGERLVVEAHGNVMFGYNGYLVWLRQR